MNAPIFSLRLACARLACAVVIASALLQAPAFAARRAMPDVVEDALAFATTDRAKAIALLESALEEGPSEKELDAIAVHAGEQRRLAADPDGARRWFMDVSQRVTKGPDAEAARLGLALLEAAGGLDSRILTVLSDVPEKDALATQNADRYGLLATAAATAGRDQEVAGFVEKARAFASEDPAVKARLEPALAALATAPAQAQGPAPTGALPVTSGQKSTLDRAEEALASGRREDARRLAEEARASAPAGSPEQRAAAYLLRKVDGPGVAADTIGVILPLSGKYGAAGQQAKEALEFGYRAGSGTRKLVFLDSGSTGELAVKALEQAVLEKGAIAVVGPLLTDETEAAVAAAEALRVPLLSLSRSLDATEELDWTVQAMMSPRDEIAALLDQVMGKDGLTSFVVFAPKSSYGERSTGLFRELVGARGGTVSAVQFYDPASNDLMGAAKALGRKDYEARAAEFRKLKEESRTNGGDPYKVVLPPLMDFQAIFVPDNATRVPLAAAALAYEEFPMGEFQPTKTSPFIPLLGLSGWNDEQLFATGGPYVRRGYFTDAFVRPNNGWTAPPEITGFIDSYRATTGRAPTSLEAIVSDAGRIVAQAAATNASTPAAFRDALLKAHPADTITHVRGVDPETHRVERDLWILTVLDTGIVPHANLTPQ